MQSHLNYVLSEIGADNIQNSFCFDFNMKPRLLKRNFTLDNVPSKNQLK